MNRNVDDVIETFQKLLLSSSKTATFDSDNYQISHCLFCSSDHCFEVVDGFVVCVQCQRVNRLELDNGAEWRTFSNGGFDNSTQVVDQTRIGSPATFLLPDCGTGTIIGHQPNESFAMRRIRRYHTWKNMNYKGKNLAVTLDGMQSKADKGNIPTIVVERAKILYKEASTAQLFRGKNKQGLIAVCMHRSCREMSVPRSMKEIADMFGVSEQVMTRGNRCLSKTFSNAVVSDGIGEVGDSNVVVITSPVDYLSRFCSKLHCSERTIEKSLKIASLIETSTLIPDNTASSIAAGVVYFVSCELHEPLSKADIAAVSKTSEVTISKCSKKITKLKSMFHSILNESL